MSLKHKSPSLSGAGSYIPICFMHHIKVWYTVNKPIPTDIIATTIQCGRKQKVCPINFYSGS